MTNAMTTPVLAQWFAHMDSDAPDHVLDMITSDFVMSVQFSKGDGQSAEFVGDRDGLIGYLAQREKSTLIHHVDVGVAASGHELVLGRTTRAGEFEASFTATAQIDSAGQVRRLLIARTPEVDFA
ncbi:hypothetical protein [Tomitella biformata]|uniref:hypothetical protein n=1 Tax=Tomitella biformata TaxID=630403 RepID=UPI00046748D9|nr:hypothetical protein [Tomitella biformata]